MGAGRTEFAMSLFGKSYGCHISGKVRKGGKEIDTSTVPKAIENGLAYLPEDRKSCGLVLGETISRNISMANLKRVSKGGIVNPNKEIAETGENAGRFGVKCSSIFQAAGNLSGGNQQKVVLAKWLSCKPKVLILDNPTQGVDVGAKEEIYDIILKLAKEGVAVIVLSSEAQEVIRVCDRALVMYHGAIVGEVRGETMTEHEIMRLATGG